ncbi:hypothetical protein KRMM14A1004_39390 [Krasilnikovia sp. MM14-A1004]
MLQGHEPPAGQQADRAWNPREQWEISPPGVHPALVNDTDFLGVQRTTAVAAPDDGNLNRYRLTGLATGALISAHRVARQTGRSAQRRTVTAPAPCERLGCGRYRTGTLPFLVARWARIRPDAVGSGPVAGGRWPGTIVPG